MIQDLNNYIYICVHSEKKVFAHKIDTMKSPLAFYTLMQYPEPIAKVYFYYKKKVTAIHTIDQKIQTPTIETQKKIDKIKKYKRLRKHIPYIHHIYICDSISFNASNT
jgi:hypothetical protein